MTSKVDHSKVEVDKEKTERLTGAEAILRCLIAEGVDTIFGYPGGAIMPVYDSLYHYTDQLEHILPRHEQGAIHAAQGYARVSRKTGVCMATSGPGATNLITGLGDAILDSTPLVCITGQVYKHLLGSDAFQETDVINCTMPVTKWNYQITTAAEIPEIFAKAFFIANSGRPGPVVIDITKNAQIEEFDFVYQGKPTIRSYHPFPKPSQETLQDAADLINNAQKTNDPGRARHSNRTCSGSIQGVCRKNRHSPGMYHTRAFVHTFRPSAPYGDAGHARQLCPQRHAKPL
jgi:acetolactate synthase-1/2/3 large subunit